MTLRNKDGTIYKLVGPNPAMKDQNLWDEFKVHNMQWEDEKAEDTNKVNPIASDFDVRDTFLSALDKAKSDIKVVETKPEIPEPVIERKPLIQPDLQREEAEAAQEDIQKVFIHVLPAYLRERRTPCTAIRTRPYNTVGRPLSRASFSNKPTY